MTALISKEEIAEIRRLADEMPPDDALSSIQTFPELFAYAAHCARDRGSDEADFVETLAVLLELPRQHLRQAERLLRRLGYVAVADRLKTLMPRAKPRPRRLRRSGRVQKLP